MDTRGKRAGIAEIIKYGVIWDRGSLSSWKKTLMRFLQGNRLEKAIERSCAIKAAVVS